MFGLVKHFQIFRKVSEHTYEILEATWKKDQLYNESKQSSKNKQKFKENDHLQQVMNSIE